LEINTDSPPSKYFQQIKEPKKENIIEEPCYVNSKWSMVECEERLLLGGGKVGGRPRRGRRGGKGCKIRGGDWYGDNEEDPYGFSIQDIENNVSIENISPSILPNFNDMRTKDFGNFSFCWNVATGIFQF